jgi:hypothetical protein
MREPQKNTTIEKEKVKKTRFVARKWKQATKTLPALQREERLPGWKGSILTVI